MDPLSPSDWALALVIAVGAGAVKGAVGFALPLVLISGLSSFLDPKLALAGIIVPILGSNAVQTFRRGVAPAIEASRLHWRYLLVVVVAIFVAAQFVAVIPRDAFYLVLGVPVVVLSTIQLIGWRPTIPPERRNLGEWGSG